MMEGRSVALRRPSDGDYALVEVWLVPTFLTAVLTVEDRGFVAADEVREANSSDAGRHFMVRLKEADRSIGCVNHNFVCEGILRDGIPHPSVSSCGAKRSDSHTCRNAESGGVAAS